MPFPCVLWLGNSLSLPFFYASHQVFINMDKILLSLLFMLTATISLSFSSYKRCSIPLVVFVALCWTCFTMPIPLLYWGTQHSSCCSLVLNRGKRAPSGYMLWAAFAVCWVHIAGSWSACPPGPLGPSLQSCFPAGQPSACTGVWQYSSSAVRLWTSPLLNFIRLLFALFSSFLFSLVALPSLSGNTAL